MDKLKAEMQKCGRSCAVDSSTLDELAQEIATLKDNNMNTKSEFVVAMVVNSNTNEYTLFENRFPIFTGTYGECLIVIGGLSLGDSMEDILTIIANR